MSVMDARWQRVNELFHAALLRTPADRDAFLAMECGADSQLRLEVQSLLAAHDVGGSATFASVPTPVEGPNAGGITRWGHFEVARKIGEGSFGEVYEARDTWLERSVALKLVRHERVDRSRFLHEARTLARVRHPNVVEILSAEDHDGRLGFSMELVEGDTLADVVAHEGVFSAADAAVLGHDVCGALAAVHAMGIVHRDIKAQNVMRESENGRIVLMDFGAGEAMKLSRAAVGNLSGTPLYLAPEIFDGHPATIQTDIYAVGVLLFYLVTRRFPVHGHSVDDLIRAHGNGERIHLRDLRPDLPNVFTNVVETMLAHDPASRYRSAPDARATLETLLPSSLRLRLSNSSVPQSGRGIFWRLGTWSAVSFAIAAVMLLGLIASAAFNVAFGRRGFTVDTGVENSLRDILAMWFAWGVRSLVAPVIVLLQASIMLTVIVAAARVVSRFVTRAGKVTAALHSAWDAIAFSRRLDEPNRMMKLVACAGAVMFAMLVLVFWRDATAFGILISESSPERLALLQPANESRYDWYPRFLEAALFVYGCLMYVAYSSARRRRVHVRSTVSAFVVAVPFVALLMMRAVPYRIVYHNDFERVDLDNTRCYQIGKRPGDVLLHCPDVAPPRNRVVSANDPRLHPSAVRESIFTPRDQSRH